MHLNCDSIVKHLEIEVAINPVGVNKHRASKNQRIWEESHNFRILLVPLSVHMSEIVLFVIKAFGKTNNKNYVTFK